MSKKVSELAMWTALSLVASACSVIPLRAQARTVVQSGPGPGGTIHVPAFELPLSSLLSSETRTILIRKAKHQHGIPCAMLLSPKATTPKGIAEARACVDKTIFGPLIRKQKSRYDATMETTKIAGVGVQIFRPRDGERDRGWVLIDLHGGAMVVGAGTESQVESIPIAAVGRFKVISVDYRLAPENKFPAASEDVVAVYRELLKSYKAEDIGIYGCSAGGELTGQVIAWLIEHRLPLPGAIGIFCAAPVASGGDSAHIVAALSGLEFSKSRALDSYYRGVPDQGNPLIFPFDDPRTARQFPPTLLITGTRDFGMSGIVHAHSQLVRCGVDAELHVWEGMEHGFFADPDLQESRDAYGVIVDFFDKHLGHQ